MISAGMMPSYAANQPSRCTTAICAASAAEPVRITTTRTKLANPQGEEEIYLVKKWPESVTRDSVDGRLPAVWPGLIGCSHGEPEPAGTRGRHPEFIQRSPGAGRRAGGPGVLRVEGVREGDRRRPALPGSGRAASRR